MSAVLYIIATPIGNLEDMTHRAVRILSEVDVVAAEDTRQTRKLLERYSISPPRLVSCRARNEAESAPGLIKLLEQGLDMAYVSDAGTPGISDPGSVLVATARKAGFSVIPLPGASAASALVSVSGLPGKGYVFEGFLSPKSGRRRTRLNELLSLNMPFVLYESPYRVIKLLTDLSELDPHRDIVVGREMTKKFEEFPSGSVVDVLAELSARPSLKGEFALLVGVKKKG